MAIIEDIVEDARQSPSLAAIVKTLRVPVEFSWREWETDEQTLSTLARWKLDASNALQELLFMSNSGAVTSVEDRASAIMAAAALNGEDAFCTNTSRTLAEECLPNLLPPPSAKNPTRQDVIKRVLQHEIKPLFMATAHPGLNLDSGRKLSRLAGGESAGQDMFEDQIWKQKGAGCWNALRWCIQNVQKEDFATLWPLLIPPMMTLVDDYDPPYKIQGIIIVNEMLARVGPALLKRTGIDMLLFSSLSTALTFVTVPETPEILRTAVPCYLTLIQLTTSPGSQQQFDALCQLITTAIIGGAWAYGGKDLKTIEASVHVLPPLIRALDIGTARFLKALIPQLVENIIDKPFAPVPIKLQIISANCLAEVTRVCRPRIPYWKDRILDGLLRCWVFAVENAPPGDDAMFLKASLRELAQELVASCPTLREKEIPRLQDLDSKMFSPLFHENVA